MRVMVSLPNRKLHFLRICVGLKVKLRSFGILSPTHLGCPDKHGIYHNVDPRGKIATIRWPLARQTGGWGKVSSQIVSHYVGGGSFGCGSFRFAVSHETQSASVQDGANVSFVPVHFLSSSPVCPKEYEAKPGQSCQAGESRGNDFIPGKIEQTVHG